MSEEHLYPIGCRLQGVIELLGTTLGTDENTPIRVLLRSASDANALRAKLAARQGLSPSELALGIRVSIESQQRALTVHDNGIGMTEEELRRHLGDIAQIVARQTPRSLEQSEPNTEDDYMRAFAVLPLHMVAFADEVTIDTLSHKPGSTPCRLRYWGGEQYELRPGQAEAVGTSVTVSLKPQYAHLCDAGTVPELLRLFGDYLPFPIFWEDRQINTMSPPWYQSEATVADYAAFLRSRYPQLPAPLLVIPLSLQRGPIELRGVLWVPGQPLSVLDEQLGRTDIYWRRMLALPNEAGMLPHWARFITGIVDSNLPPQQLCYSDATSASGFHLPAVLEEVLLDAFKQILIEDPESFAPLAQRHDQLLKLAALENDELFELVADHLLFTTASGRKSLAECVSEVVQTTGKPTIRYQSMPLGSVWAVFRQHRLSVIDASAGLDEAILEKYDRTNPSVELEDIEATETHLFEEVTNSNYQPLLELFSEMEPPVTARPARFQPVSIAAIISPTRDDPMRPQLEQLFLLSQITGVMPAEARSAMQRALSAGPPTTTPKILHINVDSPVIKAMLHALMADQRELAGQVAQLTLLRAQIAAGGLTDSGQLRDLSNDLLCRVLGYRDDGQPLQPQ